jgi:hypothetical protein
VYLGILVVTVLLMFIVMFSVLDASVFEELKKAVQAKQTPVPDPRMMFIFNIFMLLMGVLMLALSFAPALTHWKRMPTFKAIFYSVFAILGSKGPFAVMLLVWMAWYALATMLIGAILGKTAIVNVIVIWMTFIAVLIFHCAIYAAYKQILGAPEDEAATLK